MEKIAIRQAKESDVEAIKDVLIKGWLETYGVQIKPKPKATSWIVACIGNKVVGVSKVVGTELIALYVLKEYQSHGVGTALINHSQIDSLNVWDKNVRAIQFYNRLGFKRSQEKVKPVTGLGGVILNQIRLTKGD